MGTGFHGGFGNTAGANNNNEGTTSKVGSISSNIEAMKNQYPLTKNGYFGEKGKNHRVAMA